MHIIQVPGNSFIDIFLFSDFILILKKKKSFILSHKLLLSVSSGFKKFGFLSLCLSIQS